MIEIAIPQKDPQKKDVEQQVLIGRKGLFDKYKITFNEADKTIRLTRYVRP